MCDRADDQFLFVKIFQGSEIPFAQEPGFSVDGPECANEIVDSHGSLAYYQTLQLHGNWLHQKTYKEIYVLPWKFNEFKNW